MYQLKFDSEWLAHLFYPLRHQGMEKTQQIEHQNNKNKKFGDRNKAIVSFMNSR